MKMLLHIFLLSLVAGCASLNLANNKIKKRHTEFGVNSLSDRWQKKSFRHADLFFAHKDHDASIYINAQCEKFSDSPLEALTAQNLIGMGSYTIVKQQRIMLNDREALVSEIEVNLDGVNRFLKMMVYRKNRCVYDAVLVADTEHSDVTKDFDDMVMSFWAEADL